MVSGDRATNSKKAFRHLNIRGCALYFVRLKLPFLAAWVALKTSPRLAGQVQAILQAAGVPSGAVQNPLEVLRDPQLRHRGTIVTAHHDPDWWGTLEHPGVSIRLSDTPGWATDSTPNMGQDNDRVYKQILGLTEAEIAALTEEGALR